MSAHAPNDVDDALSMRDRILVPMTGMLLGMCVLAPFNALVSSTEYFHDTFRHTPLESVFSSGVMIVFNATAVVCSITAMLFQGRAKLLPVRRIYVMLRASVILSCVMIVLMWMRGAESSSSPTLYYILLLSISIALALVQTYLQNATMGLCTRLDISGYVTGYMLFGQALNGVVGSLVNLVSSISSSRHVGGGQAMQNKMSALAVYVSTAFLQLVTWWAFGAMQRVPHVKDRMDAWVREDEADQCSASLATHMSWSRIKRVQKRLVSWSACIFGLFAVTLCVYPGITSRVRTVSNNAWLRNDGIFVALHIVCMNVGDLIGRRLPILVPATNVRRVSVAMACTAARILFLPFFVACHIDGRMPGSIPDSAFFLCVWGVGLTTGWLSTSFLISGPQEVHGGGANASNESYIPLEDEVAVLHPSQAHHAAAQDATIASMLFSFWIVSGLTFGGILSLFVNFVLE